MKLAVYNSVNVLKCSKSDVDIYNSEQFCSKQERRSTLECVKCLRAYTNNRVRNSSILML